MHSQPPIGPHNTDGLLVFSDGLVDDDLANLNASGFPMVLVHRTPPPYLSIPSVTVENVEATEQLVEHLVQGTWEKTHFVPARSHQPGGFDAA